jgi:hypothetical protein
LDITAMGIHLLIKNAQANVRYSILLILFG